MHLIYRITNLLNNKVYIGQTNNPNLRWSQHKSNAKFNPKQIISRAISKYGMALFVFDVIACCQSQDDANFLESFIIKQYDSTDLNIGYNIDPGGNSPTRSIQTNKKISQSLLIYYQTHNSANKGIKLNQTWKDNLSKAGINKPGTNQGKTFPNEWTSKISMSLIGSEHPDQRKFDPDTENTICNLYLNNVSMYRIGKQFMCPASTVSSILKRHSIAIRSVNKNGLTIKGKRKNLFTSEEELLICKRYNQHDISIARLAIEFKCSKTCMRSILLRNGIKF